jgi:hypothetical protein
MKTIGHILGGGNGRRVIGIISGPDAVNQVITVNGRPWRFDFDEMGGPLWLKADGTTPRACQNPNRAVWDAFQIWHDNWKPTASPDASLSAATPSPTLDPPIPRQS